MVNLIVKRNFTWQKLLNSFYNDALQHRETQFSFLHAGIQYPKLCMIWKSSQSQQQFGPEKTNVYFSNVGCCGTKLNESNSSQPFLISKSCKKVQKNELILLFLGHITLTHKVWKRCYEMERKNCSLTLFHYNLHSVKVVRIKGKAVFKISCQSSVSTQFVLQAIPNFSLK